ncbi:hypothetical protein CN685_28585, partial [Bacillus wiedmannii]
MSLMRVTFQPAMEAVLQTIEEEKIISTPLLQRNILHMLSNICHYEEEGLKIRPNLIIANEIERITETIPSLEIIEITQGDLTGKDMMKCLKSIFPFCNNGWIVYINCGGEYLSYGILRSFETLTSLSISEILFEDVDGSTGLLYFSVMGQWEIYMRGLNTSAKVIDLRFVQQVEEHENHEEVIGKLADDMTKDLEERNNICTALKKILRLTIQKVHGAICVVVKKDIDLTIGLTPFG